MTIETTAERIDPRHWRGLVWDVDEETGADSAHDRVRRERGCRARMGPQALSQHDGASEMKVRELIAL